MMTPRPEEVTTVKGGEEITTTRDDTNATTHDEGDEKKRGGERGRSEQGDRAKFRSSRGVQWEVKKDGTVGVAVDYRRQFDVSKKIGKIGGWLVMVGVLITLLAPTLFLLGFISIPLMFGLISTPFTIGAAFIALAKWPEFLPGA